MQAATTGTSFYVHIETYEETNNTHACMDDTRSHFLSESHNTKRMAISQNVLKTPKYNGACSGKFEAHCTALVKAYNDMSKQGQYYNDNIKVRHLHDSITASNKSEVAVAK